MEWRDDWEMRRGEYWEEEQRKGKVRKGGRGEGKRRIDVRGMEQKRRWEERGLEGKEENRRGG